MHNYIHRKTKNTLISCTFIPIIWTQSTAVPVAFERNSARVSSAIASRLANRKQGSLIMKLQIQVRTKRDILYLPSWVVSIPLGVLGCWVLLLLMLTAHDHRLTAIIVCGRCRSLFRILQV